MIEKQKQKQTKQLTKSPEVPLTAIIAYFELIFSQLNLRLCSGVYNKTIIKFGLQNVRFFSLNTEDFAKSCKTCHDLA